MTGTAQRETPQVAIFWLVQVTEGEARLLATGCPLDELVAYGFRKDRLPSVRQ